MARDQISPVEKKQERREQNKSFISTKYIILLGIFVLIEAYILLDEPLPLKEQVKNQLDISAFKNDYPLVVLYKGRSSEYEYEWSTAAWTGWGERIKIYFLFFWNLFKKKLLENKNLYKTASRLYLPWAAEGTYISKSCNVSCYVTSDQDLLQLADVVVMEVCQFFNTFNELSQRNLFYFKNS